MPPNLFKVVKIVSFMLGVLYSFLKTRENRLNSGCGRTQRGFAARNTGLAGATWPFRSNVPRHPHSCISAACPPVTACHTVSPLHGVLIRIVTAIDPLA